LSIFLIASRLLGKRRQAGKRISKGKGWDKKKREEKEKGGGRKEEEHDAKVQPLRLFLKLTLHSILPSILCQDSITKISRGTGKRRGGEGGKKKREGKKKEGETEVGAPPECSSILGTLRISSPK